MKQKSYQIMSRGSALLGWYVVFVVVLAGCTTQNVSESQPTVQTPPPGQAPVAAKPRAHTSPMPSESRRLSPSASKTTLASGLESRAQGSVSSQSPDGVTHKTPIRDVWSVGALWGLMTEVERPEQSIFATADISEGLARGMFPADYTTINVVRRVNHDVIELGVGTKAQLAVIHTASGNESRALWGQPGSTVILQPEASVIWKNSELTPSGNAAVTFKIGRKGNETVISSIEGGTLRFTRANAKGKKIAGILCQSDNGVTETLESRAASVRSDSERKEPTKTEITWEEVSRSNDIVKHAHYLKAHPNEHLTELSALVDKFLREKVREAERQGMQIMHNATSIPANVGGGTTYYIGGGMLKLGPVLWLSDPTNVLAVRVFNGYQYVQGKGIGIMGEKMYCFGF